MTGTEFRQTHGDPTTWTTAEIEAQQNLAACDAHHHIGGTTNTGKGTNLQHLTPDTKASANRLRQLLAPAA
ncbi:hypothetical protein [Streptomyces californicus]|uniref:hypothetical protein n=1 Tax=Streptomyces californicus TaxID=67351 RepID=UPI0004C1DE4F|nr:hypothetical protein [Streptomyces californicus]QRV59347.1 hypothetical protein I6J40_34365 [Streptomyces californicus]